jgi:hypothetical protein
MLVSKPETPQERVSDKPTPESGERIDDKESRAGTLYYSGCCWWAKPVLIRNATWSIRKKQSYSRKMVFVVYQEVIYV